MKTADTILKAIAPARFGISNNPNIDPGGKAPLHGKLHNQIVLISDGDTPMGRLIAVALASEGAHIAVIHSGNRQEVLKTKAAVEKQGKYVMVLEGNPADEKSSNRMIREVMFKFGQLNILINHIDYGRNKNISSCLHLTREALVFMKSNSCIINTVSWMADDSRHVLSFGDCADEILHFTGSLRESLVHTSIRLCGIAPFSYNCSGTSFETGKPVKQPNLMKANEIAALFSHIASSGGKVLNDHIIFPARKKARQHDNLSQILGSEVKEIYA